MSTLLLILFVFFMSQSGNASETRCAELDGIWNSENEECCCPGSEFQVRMFSPTDPVLNPHYFPFGKCVSPSRFIEEFQKQFSNLQLFEGPLLEPRSMDAKLAFLDRSDTFEIQNKSQSNFDSIATYWNTKYFGQKATEHQAQISPEGRILRQDGTPWDTSSSQSIYSLYLGKETESIDKDSTRIKVQEKGLSIYVLDRENRLLILDRQETGRFHHSSLVDGNPVKSAGEIAIQEGRLNYLNNSSYHYSIYPVDLLNTLKILASQRVSLDRVDLDIFYPKTLSCNKKTSHSKRKNYVEIDQPVITGYLFNKKDGIRATLRGKQGTSWFGAEAHRFRNWLIHEGTFLNALADLEIPQQRQALSLALLHTFAKSSPYSTEIADTYEFNISPLHLSTSNNSYYRSSDHPLQKMKVRQISKALQIEPNCVKVTTGNGFKSVLERIYPQSHSTSGDAISVSSQFDLFRMGEQITKAGFRDLLLVDFSNWSTPVAQIRNELNSWLARQRGQSFPSILFFGFLKPQNAFVHFYYNGYSKSVLCDSLQPLPILKVLAQSGFKPTQDQLEALLLESTDVQTILHKLNIPWVSLPHHVLDPSRESIKLESVLSFPLVQRFSQLGNHRTAPSYLQIYPRATFDLLQGLAKSVDNFFGNPLNSRLKGLRDQLTSHLVASIANALIDADDYPKFMNRIEEIHTTIQTFLSLVEPYTSSSYQKISVDHLTSGFQPIIPSGYPAPKVWIRNSGMHAFSTVLTAIEKQKRTRFLNIAHQKGTYFEIEELIEKYGTYRTIEIDGNRFNATGKIHSHSIFPFSKTPLIDLYVGDFHHNFSLLNDTYEEEQVTQQILELVHKGAFAKQFTVALDVTITHPESIEIRSFLENPEIQNLILSGRMNAVFFRSAQKFEMLGLDNYGGGSVTCVNQEAHFGPFLQQMELLEDQLQGLSYQGLTHIQKYAFDSVKKYQQAIIQSTQNQYQRLSGILQGPGFLASKPIYLARTKDSLPLFLDIRFENADLSKEVFKHFATYLSKNKIPFMNRGSFGFPMNNVTWITDTQWRLTVGLENEETQKVYFDFFEKIQNRFDSLDHKHWWKWGSSYYSELINPL